MHAVAIPQVIIDRIVRRRGAIHLFDDLDPRKTALLVIDAQNVYLVDGQPAFVPMARTIAPNINRLAQVARRAGGRVVWLKNTFAPRGERAWPTWYRYFRKGEQRERMVEGLRDGSFGHQLWEGMDVQPGDAVLKKHRYSAFIQGSSDLEPHLREQGIDTLLITGTVTNVCCESTARDAMMLDYRTIVVADATAAHTDEEHNASLGNILLVFGDVMTTDEVIERLEGRPERAAKPIW